MRRLILLLLVLTTFAIAQRTPPPQIPSKIQIAKPSEPGERLKLTGTVYQSDGKTPLANAVFFAYHTDNNGIYSRRGNDDSRNPRLFGWVKTDKDGRFEIDSIKPGSYPEGGNPAHIHIVFYDNGVEGTADECWFEGDRYLSQRMKDREAANGEFSRIVKLTKGSNVAWHGEWKIRKR